MSVPDGTYRVFCAGENGNKRWLAMTSPKDRDNPSAAVLKAGAARHWLLRTTSKGTTIGTADHYLFGIAKTGEVGLKLGSGTGTGAHWEITVKGEYYRIRCMDTSGEKRYLDGKTNTKEDGYLYLNSDDSKSGAQWLLIPV